MRVGESPKPETMVPAASMTVRNMNARSRTKCELSHVLAYFTTIVLTPAGAGDYLVSHDPYRQGATMLRMACRVCVTALLGAMAATPAFATGIATVTNVVNDGFRQPPGGDERRAETSDELVSDEALRTERDSSIAVKFVDGSELSVEAQSEVVLSDYLFDPQASAATGTIKLNAGLFHFNSNNT